MRAVFYLRVTACRSDNAAGGGLMNARGLLAVLSIAAAPTASFATVVFQNTGTTSGWDYLSTQNKGTLTQVTSPVYKGTTAVRARQIYVSGASERFHSELGKRNVGKR